MKKVLVDTSVWIDALNGIDNWQTALLNKLIDDNTVVLSPTVIQEILQGIKLDTDHTKVKVELQGFEVLGLDPIEAAYGAAAIYRKARKQGITIRKSNDCLIAFYAISNNTVLLHNDSDMDSIAMCTTLKVATDPGQLHCISHMHAHKKARTNMRAIK